MNTCKWAHRAESIKYSEKNNQELIFDGIRNSRTYFCLTDAANIVFFNQRIEGQFSLVKTICIIGSTDLDESSEEFLLVR